MERGFRRPRKKVRRAGRVNIVQGYLPSIRLSIPGKKEVARAAPRLSAEIARSPRGWALVGGRIVERVSAEPDEAVGVGGDRAHVPGRLNRLGRLHLHAGRVGGLLLDLRG